MKTCLILCAMAAALALSACQSDYDARVPGAIASPEFGNAVRANIAAQKTNPNAPSNEPLKASGAVTAIAVDRYEHDAVKAPADTGSSSGGTGMSTGTSGRK